MIKGFELVSEWRAGAAPGEAELGKLEAKLAKMKEKGLQV